MCLAEQSKTEIRREKRKKCMRKLRQSIKSDPVQYEEYKQKERERYQRRKEAGKIKLIGAMNEREKRVIRKEWRRRSKRSYDVKKQRKAVERFLEEQTPPSASSPSPVPSDANCSSSSSIHRRQALGEKIKKSNLLILEITLPTIVTYHKPVDSSVQSTSFCTLSESLLHDPSLICAHLLPLIYETRMTVPSLRNVHSLTDGPTTQYRNKKMFYFLAKFLGKRLDVETIRWHINESGRGKGAPDGIGDSGGHRDDENPGDYIDQRTRGNSPVSCTFMFAVQDRLNLQSLCDVYSDSESDNDTNTKATTEKTNNRRVH
ncbi:hypothetical protein ILUMI_08646, partial [Ignelater luminosus]